MKINLTNIFVFLLIVWSIVYIFFSHRFGQYDARWTTETFKEGATSKHDDMHWMVGGTDTPHDDEALKPPPQIGNVNYTHNHASFHPDTYKYLADIEQSFDDLQKIYKSKPIKITPKVVKLSTGLNPYEYAQWQQVLPDVFSQPLYGKKCQSSDLSDAIKSVRCKAPRKIPYHLSEFNPYLSQAPAHKHEDSGSQDNSSTSQNGTSSSYRGGRNVITINVDDNRNTGSKQYNSTQNNEDDDTGKIGKIANPPSKGYESFYKKNDTKLVAKNDDNYAVGADTLTERPG